MVKENDTSFFSKAVVIVTEYQGGDGIVVQLIKQFQTVTDKAASTCNTDH